MQMMATRSYKGAKNVWAMSTYMRCNHCGLGAKYCKCTCSVCGAPMFSQVEYYENGSPTGSARGKRVKKFRWEWHGSAIACEKRRKVNNGQ